MAIRLDEGRKRAAKMEKFRTVDTQSRHHSKTYSALKLPATTPIANIIKFEDLDRTKRPCMKKFKIFPRFTPELKIPFRMSHSTKKNNEKMKKNSDIYCENCKEFVYIDYLLHSKSDKHQKAFNAELQLTSLDKYIDCLSIETMLKRYQEAPKDEGSTSLVP